MPEENKKSDGRDKEEDIQAIFCELCGAKMDAWQCRYVCKNCGNTTSCSEENVFFED